MVRWIFIAILGTMTLGVVGCQRHLKAQTALLSANAHRYKWVTAREKEVQDGFDALDSRPRQQAGAFSWGGRH